MRAALFALPGVAIFAYWVVAHPSFEQTASQSQWPTVLAFSAALLTLAIALPVFGRMVGGRSVGRLALLAGAAIAGSSLANIFEDGLHLDWVFFVFILGIGLADIALLMLTVEIARTGRGAHRLLALVPGGTLAGIFLMVIAGGPIMLVTWLAAAASALVLAGHSVDSPA